MTTVLARQRKPLHGVAALLHGLALTGCAPEPAPDVRVAPTEQARYVGGQSCAACHPAETERWTGSHHDLAMQDATPGTVLGDFSDARFSYNGVTTEFFTRQGAYWTRTDGPDGELAEYEITHTFGVAPLQQYLVRFPDGRYQALSVAWDTRSQDQGGQRWFHLYPDAEVDHADPLHWTGTFQRWNTACAECHSTDVRKNYSPLDERFDTTYASVDVDCEACHGPGSLHVRSPETFTLALPTDTEASWLYFARDTIARRVPALQGRAEAEVCAQCHSRRSQLTDEHTPGDPLLDAFQPSLLDAGLYHADGQILDEVYVYGSFLQSRMHAAGVTCSDCHDPHSGELRFAGNALCGQCHLPSAYVGPSHHHHARESPASACVACHMPAQTYMVVDSRRDHSFRVPRPDLSVELGTPNACNGCHSDESAAWAARVVAEWFPQGRSGAPHFGEALHAAREWQADRGPLLLALANDAAAPAIARATAVSLLAAQLDGAALRGIALALQGDEPLVQIPALEALAGAPLETRVDLAQRFLTHPLRALRIAAARTLAAARPRLSERRRNDLDTALAEYRDAQAFNSDRPEGRLNAATLLAEEGQLAAAAEALQRVVGRDPYFTAAYVNLADLYRQTGREAEAERLLRTAVERNAEDPAAHFALGLSLVRSGQLAAALEALDGAASLAPAEPYYQYVLGIALNSTGQRGAALQTLHAAHERFPGHRDVLVALATIHRDGAELEQARLYAERLLALSPTDTTARALLEEIGAAPP